MSSETGTLPADLANDTGALLDQAQEAYASLCLNPDGLKRYLAYIGCLMATMTVSFALWIFMRYTRHELLSQLEKKSWELYRTSAKAERARLKAQTRRKFEKVKNMSGARQSRK